MNQTDDLYVRMKEAEQKIQELNEAFIRIKKEVYEEIDNLNYVISNKI